MGKALAGYMRVSFVGGRSGDAFRSPTDQAGEITAWANRHGHRVTLLEPELDRKGSDAERPIFRQVVEGVKAGEFAGVVVAYLSRAGRDLRLMLELWTEVEAAGGAIYSARENIDGTAASGRLHRNILASIAQHELEQRRDDFERQRASATERGIWQRRQTPRGYDRDPETRRLVPNGQAGDVLEAAQAVLAGEPMVKIAGQLGMTPSGVRQMLRNRVYLGELKVGRHVNPEAHEPILDVETFEAVQAILARRTRTPKHRKPGLLIGLVRCASCGHVMTRANSKGTLNYACPTNHSGERCPAPAAVACHRLDPYVEAVARAELRHLQARGAGADRARDLRREVEEARSELSAYLAAVDAAGIGAADAAEGMRARREQVDIAEARLRDELARAPTFPQLLTGDTIWDDLDVQDRNELLRGLLTCVVVRPAGRGRRVPIDERARVIRFGALSLPGNSAERGFGIAPIRFDGLDSKDVLGISAREDSLERPGGVV